jgi:predicted nucleic acid-binding protein
MTSGYQAILDACVLVNAALRDTLLRLAEPPHLYLPRWSDEIIGEMKRTLENKMEVSRSQCEHLESELRKHFEDSWVHEYEPLVSVMANHWKDRHVLAAAVKTGAQAIVTFNLKDFSSEALRPWNVQAQSPDDFLIDQYHLEPSVVREKLQQQADYVYAGDLQALLKVHSRTVPRFAQLLLRDPA